MSTYTISTDESHDVGRGPFRQSDVETEAALLVPVPDPSGVLIIGQDTITFHDGKNLITASPEILQEHLITCTTKIDKNRKVFHTYHHFLIFDFRRSK